MILDLGCGGRLESEDAIGIDLVAPPNSRASIICNLGFEPIPFDDDSCELVVAHHFIEHLPFVLWYREDGKWIKDTPVIYLFNDVYRVLKSGGIFKVTVPMTMDMFNQGHGQGLQDPTHVGFWVPETVNYFSGDYYGFHEVYHHKTRFELISREMLEWYMCFQLKARKDLIGGRRIDWAADLIVALVG